MNNFKFIFSLLFTSFFGSHSHQCNSLMKAKFTLKLAKAPTDGVENRLYNLELLSL